MSDQVKKSFVTNGSVEYFAEREKRLKARLKASTDAIDGIEEKMRDDLREVHKLRLELSEKLMDINGILGTLQSKRESMALDIQSLYKTIALLETDIPQVSKMVEQLEKCHNDADLSLAELEKSKRRQLHKHERSKDKYEQRAERLRLRRDLILGSTEERLTSKET